MIERRRWCDYCERETLHSKELMIGNGWGCLLTILTAGLFIPLWLLLGVLEVFRPLRCRRCGGGRYT